MTSCFALGRITDLAAESEYLTGPEKDVVKLRFPNAKELALGDFAQFPRQRLGHVGNMAAGR